ncbi:pantothenate kinase [Aphanothece hegewaldii CCALA 016]|uniref:Type III pantothenate kinase n=1 Tax=Aphanothece hegewaldii CCALA 016 TaxID=2107694 RepID=A0A2T1M116_9CHRO|nr:pantothenate kinase [Aphanothece hegewaldii]PSF38380.1 pantothenate kinase [Aphanothece hegewaldii CCALA 016]
MNNSLEWLALIIGNSRLHWAWFEQYHLKKTWHTPHLTNVFTSIENCLDLPIYLASVVPSQTTFFQNYPHFIEIKLEQIPLKKLYPTLGIDRAITVLGAGESYGYPCLVIDVGTALTFTGIDAQKNFIGGAILPGFRLQFQSLSSQTAALPTVALPDKLPHLWENTTQTAIESGIIYNTLAGVHYFISDWLTQFPNAKILITGGDGLIIFNYLLNLFPYLNKHIKFDAELGFWGMRSLRQLL